MRRGSCLSVASCLLGVALASASLHAQDFPSSALAVEPLLEQAQALREAGDLRAAHETLHVAFQNSRARDGLYHSEQLPILEQLLGSSLALEEWQQFLQQADFIERMTYRVHGSTEPAWQMMERLSLWHLAAAARMASEQSVWHVLKARSLLWQALSRIEAVAGRESPRLIPLLQQIVLNHYYMARATQRRGITSYALRVDDPVFLSGWAQADTEMRRANFQVGVELLQRIREIRARAGADAEALAQASLELADWYYLFGRETLALAHYREAHSLLREAGLDATALNAFFGRTVILPALQAEETPVFRRWSPMFPGMQPPPDYPWEAEAGQQRAQWPLVAQWRSTPVLSGNLSEWRDSDLDAPPVSATEADLAALQIRPLFRDGEPVQGADIALTYEITLP